MTSIRKGFKRKSNDVPHRSNGHQKTPGPAGLTPFVREQSKVPDFGAMSSPFGDVSRTGIDEMFKGLNGNLPQNLSSNFLDALNGVLGGYSSNASTERTDLLIQYLLQLLSTSEQRDWDKSVLAEQRLYDNPTNQLARLMSSGISRDAAIQLLSSSGGSGGSAALIGSGAGTSVPSVSGISGTHDLQVFDSVMQCLNTVGSLVSAGFSIPMAFNQYKLMSNQRYMSDEQRTAYDTSAAAFTLLSSSGLELNDENFGSIDAVCKSLERLSGSNAAVKDFIDAGGLLKLRKTAPYSSPFLNQLYRNERDSRDYNTSFGAQVSLLRAQEDLAHANKDNLRKQIDVYIQQIDTLRSTAEYNDALASLTEFQKSYLRSQTRQANASAKEVELRNQLTESWMSGTINGRTGLDMYSDYHLNELWSGVERLTYLNDNQAWKKEADAFLANQENLVSMYELATLYQRGEINVLTNSKEETIDLLNFCRAAEKSHLFEYVRTIAEVKSASKWSFNGASGTKSPDVPFMDVVENAGKEPSTWDKIWNWKPFSH